MRHSVFLALAIACATAGSALAQETASISLSPTAQLLAKGAGVRLTATVQCPAGYQGGTGGGCNERVGPTVVSGDGGVDFTCTGSPQTVQFVISPYEEGSRAFKKGPAVCGAGVYACPESGDCVSANTPTNEVVNIR
jgi:hypothetical protein